MTFPTSSFYLHSVSSHLFFFTHEHPVCTVLLWLPDKIPQDKTPETKPPKTRLSDISSCKLGIILNLLISSPKIDSKHVLGFRDALFSFPFSFMGILLLTSRPGGWISKYPSVFYWFISCAVFRNFRRCKYTHYYIPFGLFFIYSF